MGGKKEERTSEIVRESAISNRLAVFGAPGIMATDKNSRFNGKVFREFCTGRNIVFAYGNSGTSSKFRGDGTETRFVSINY